VSVMSIDRQTGVMRKDAIRNAVHRWVSMAVVAALALLTPHLAAGSDRTDKLRMAVLIKVLSYDRALTKRSSKKLVITIVYREGHERSEQAKRNLAPVLSAAGVKVQGLPVTVNTLPFAADKIAAGLKKRGTDVLYLAPGLEGAVESAHLAAKKNGAITVCGDRALVKAGIAIGVFLSARRARIAVNLGRARALGMSLDASLLSLVEVFR
jgi:hypothetical protein